MKIIFGIVFLISISAFFRGPITTTKTSQEENVITATFVELTDDGSFKFTDLEGNDIYFNEVSEEIEIDLYDDENIGIKFNIQWEEEEEMIYDDEGEETEEIETIRRIISLEESE